MTTGADGAAGRRRVIVWLRNDLRLHDNHALDAAAKCISSHQADEVLPLYCWDPRAFAHSAWGTPKMGAQRAAFLAEAVGQLREGLASVGSGLAVAVGRPEEVIAGLLEGAGPRPLVLTQQEVTSEELTADARVARVVRAAGGQLRQLWGSSLYHLDDLPFADLGRDMPDIFTPFKEKVERNCQIRPLLPTPQPGSLPLPAALRPQHQRLMGELPTWGELPWPIEGGAARPALPQPHPKAVMRFRGGEAAALERLQYYLWGSRKVSTYFDTRNGMLGPDYSTKLAPWLAAGCVSPRMVAHELTRYEAAHGSNKSTYWVKFELTWRDYFKFYALKHGNAIFREGGVVGRRLVWNRDLTLFERWREGRTGLPLVDANMRELAATGFMSNRGRQNVASYLALDVGLDWRLGADWFEHCLLDYDPASNWGNWVAAAGLTGGRLNLFNITKQSKDYDPDGDYIRTWVPELSKVPAARIHEPWLMSRAEQQQYGVELGSSYPTPIPASQLARPHGRGGGGGGDRSGGRGGRGGGRGRGGGGPVGAAPRRPRSEFERFG